MPYFGGLKIVVILDAEGRGAHIAGLEASLQPALTLVGGAVGEGFGCCTALSLLLQPVVADGFGQFETLLQVTVLHRVVHGVLIVCPDSCIVVGEQLETDADLIGLYLISLVHRLMGLAECSCEILHVVTDLMGNHVSVGKGITLDTQLSFHLREEREVDVKLLVARAIERTYGSRCITTG